MSTHKSLMIALVVTAAAGCAKPSDTASLALDQPAAVRAKGAQPQSQLTMFRSGVTDGAHALATVQIRDASLDLYADANGAILKELSLSLADSDMAGTTDMPNGVRLRNQALRLTGWLPAKVTQREADALATSAPVALEYTGELLNPDGSTTRLGPVQTEAATLDVHATRYEFGVKITIDSTPQGKCWSVPGVLEVTNCSLFVDMEGEATNL